MFRRRLAAFGILTTIVSTGATPVHPEAVNEKLQGYVAARVGEFGNIPQERRQQLGKLAAYVRDDARLNRLVRLTFICTHNSRRSQLCQIWAATAAAYYGVPHVEVFSGGMEVTAFNSRAVATLRRAGFAIDDHNPGQNPRYRVRYRIDGPELDCFSKLYSDSPNPKANFYAVMTCSQADALCPIVPGAAKRLALPFDDPKAFDGTPVEATKYDERCRQIAREMLYLFAQAQAIKASDNGH